MLADDSYLTDDGVCGKLRPLPADILFGNACQPWHEGLMGYLLVFLGAGIGGMARHAMNTAFARLTSLGGFPYGTMSINIIGSILMGVLVEYVAQKGGISRQFQLFLATGVLGGFTTFSAFSLEAMTLMHRGQFIYAAAYVLVSV